MREQAVREQAVREQAVREQAVREQAAREQAVREQAVREQAAREQAAREQAVREQAVREQAAREGRGQGMIRRPQPGPETAAARRPMPARHLDNRASARGHAPLTARACSSAGKSPRDALTRVPATTTATNRMAALTVKPTE